MKKLLLLLTLLYSITSVAQRLSDYKKDEHWYDFKQAKTPRLRLTEFVKNYKSELGLEAQDELVAKRTEKDALGITHTTYQHFFAGIVVENSELLIHSDKTSQFTELATDKLAKKLNKQTASISEPSALSNALIYVGNRRFAWLDSLAEREIKEDSKNPLATNFPKGQLIYARAKQKANEAKNYRLCYRFAIRAVAPLYSKAIYIDAINGSVFKESDLIISCNDPATATTLYNGNQNISTDWKGWPWNRFILIDCNRNIHTKYGSGWNPEAENNSTTWGTNHQAATSGHWAAEMTWDLYQQVYGRNGCNGSGREIKVLVDHPAQANNAAYVYDNDNNDKILIGNTTNGNASLSTLDIVGHEITHGLTKATADLVYENESGALNESFSDIFGFMVERRAQGGVFDWRLGEDAFVAAGGIRDLQNPNLYNQPSQVGGLFWFTGPEDNGGVHINSGVQNRWFFLLSNGGFQNGVNVNGIGIDNAALIAWRTLLFYLGENSNFNDARNGSINAAIALFGECSNEVLQVQNAWAAVGVGAAGNPNCITLNPSMVSVCYDPPTWPWYDFPFTITANFRPANGTITWNIPAGFNFTVSGNTLTVHSGPLSANLSEQISATLTSPLGNPVTATTLYTTRQCSGGGGGTEQKQNKSGYIHENLKIYSSVPYPNPVDAALNINLQHTATVQLIDFSGRLVFQKYNSSGLLMINTAKFPSGIYTLFIQDVKGNNNRYKILIQH